jgi:hypothetical protein
MRMSRDCGYVPFDLVRDACSIPLRLVRLVAIIFTVLSRRNARSEQLTSSSAYGRLRCSYTGIKVMTHPTALEAPKLHRADRSIHFVCNTDREVYKEIRGGRGKRKKYITTTRCINHTAPTPPTCSRSKGYPISPCRPL